MVYTDEEYQIIEKHLQTIETVNRNASCSNLSIEFREDITKIAKIHNLIKCPKCTTSLYLAITRIYSTYLADKAERQKLIEEENGSESKVNRKSKTTKHKDA